MAANACPPYDLPRFADRPLQHDTGDNLMRQLARHALAATSLVLGLATGPALAQADKPLELRFSSGAPPKGNPWAEQIERFARDVEDASRGDLKLQLFLGAQLGNEPDTMQQVARGRIDMAWVSASGAAVVLPELALLSLPFYFRDRAELDCVLDRHLAVPVSGLLEAKGVKFLNWGELGGSHFFGKKAYASPADLRGAKAAIFPNKTQTIFFSHFGANPAVLGVPEWVPGFQTGMIDLVSATITLAQPSGLTKVAPVATQTGASNATGMTVMSKTSFDRLSPARREALLQAVQRHPAAQLRAEVRDFERVLFDAMDQGGGRTVVASAGQRADWRQQTQAIYPQVVKELGPAGESLFKLMEAGRQACAQGQK